jgi:predicted membrane protein (TIGR00267 family)
MPRRQASNSKFKIKSKKPSNYQLLATLNTYTADKKVWLKVMMEQELKLEPIERKEALPTSIIVGAAALIGSFIPLVPFILLPVRTGMVVALATSAASLFIVGYYKAQKTTGRSLLKQGIEMMIIGMVAALVGYLVGSFFKV